MKLDTTQWLLVFMCACLAILCFFACVNEYRYHAMQDQLEEAQEKAEKAMQLIAPAEDEGAPTPQEQALHLLEEMRPPPDESISDPIDQ
jgi:hypothetical protein